MCGSTYAENFDTGLELENTTCYSYIRIGGADDIRVEYGGIAVGVRYQNLTSTG